MTDRSEEASEWLDLAQALDEVMKYIPLEHFTEEGVQSSSVYADVYPTLLAAIKECEAIGGKLTRWSRDR